MLKTRTKIDVSKLEKSSDEFGNTCYLGSIACTHCGQVKLRSLDPEVSQFYRAKKSFQGFMTQCIECRKEIAKSPEMRQSKKASYRKCRALLEAKAFEEEANGDNESYQRSRTPYNRERSTALGIIITEYYEDSIEVFCEDFSISEATARNWMKNGCPIRKSQKCRDLNVALLRHRDKLRSSDEMEKYRIFMEILKSEGWNIGLNYD